MIFQVGANGFNHHQWRGNFYPSEIGEREMLAYYANRLGAVEIETSFFRMPSPTQLESWVYETPDNFCFSLTVPRRITHQKRLKDVAGPIQDLVKGTKRMGRKLGALKFRLPPTLRANSERLKNVLSVIPNTVPVAIEFNHASWFDDNYFDCLRNHNVALVLSDSPIATSSKASSSTQGLNSLLETQTADWRYRHMTNVVYDTLELQQLLSQSASANEVRTMLFFTDTNNGPYIASQFHQMAPVTRRIMR